MKIILSAAVGLIIGLAGMVAYLNSRPDPNQPFGLEDAAFYLFNATDAMDHFGRGNRANAAKRFGRGLYGQTKIEWDVKQLAPCKYQVPGWLRTGIFDLTKPYTYSNENGKTTFRGTNVLCFIGGECFNELNPPDTAEKREIWDVVAYSIHQLCRNPATISEEKMAQEFAFLLQHK